MTCEICREETTRSLLVRHYKEKHLTYYKFYVRLAFLRGGLSGFGALVLLLLLLRDLGGGSLSLLTRICLPSYTIGLVVLWRVVELSLGKARKSQKP